MALEHGRGEKTTIIKKITRCNDHERPNRPDANTQHISPQTGQVPAPERETELVPHGVPQRGDGAVVPAVPFRRCLPPKRSKPHSAWYVRPSLRQQVGGDEEGVDWCCAVRHSALALHM